MSNHNAVLEQMDRLNEGAFVPAVCVGYWEECFLFCFHINFYSGPIQNVNEQSLKQYHEVLNIVFHCWWQFICRQLESAVECTLIVCVCVSTPVHVLNG